MRRRPMVLAAILVVLAGIAVHLHRRPQPFILVPPPAPLVQHTAPLQPVLPVAVELARLGTVHDSRTCTAVVLPSSEEILRAPLPGTVKAIKVKLGSRVFENQVLAVLAETTPTPTPTPRPGSSPAPEQVRLNADVEMAEKDLQEAAGDVSRARAAVDQAQANQEAVAKTADQDQTLLAQGAIARNDYEADVEAVDQARTQTNQAQDHLAQLQQTLERQRQLVERERGLRLTVLAASQPRPTPLVMPAVNLSDHNGVIKSGLAGVIMKCCVKVGQTIKPRTALFRIGRIDMLRIRGHLPPADMNTVKVGAVALVHAATVPYPLQAELSKVAADGQVETMVANPGKKLAPGAVVRMEVPLGEHDDVVTIPAAALQNIDGRPMVWIAHERETQSVAIQVPVVPGVRDGDRLEIVEGLQAGDAVIWRGMSELENGMEVLPDMTDSGTRPASEPLSPEARTACSSGSPEACPSGSPPSGSACPQAPLAAPSEEPGSPK